MSALAIHARGVQKHFTLDDGSVKKAVDDVSFDIREGERVGFVGRNGAGKTTLLQVLAGISGVTGGELDVRGKVTSIFTLGVGLREDLTGRENIYVEGELQGRSRSQTEPLVDEIVNFAELGPFIDRPVRTYSTGMKARLAFSTIVNIEPEILIVDEALSVGDAKFAEKATRKMRELTSRGRILILVSHSMAAINDMCTRAIWLDGGRVVRDGVPAEVTRAYLDEVRTIDEAKLAERFRSEVLDESNAPGWRVTGLEFESGSPATPALTLITGEPAILRIDAAGEPGRTFDALLHLRRLDGLLVREDAAGSRGCRPVIGADGRIRLRLGLGALPLNWGTYLARIDLLLEGQIVARRSTLFEVVNPRPPKGGRPVLIYPAYFNVTPLVP